MTTQARSQEKTPGYNCCIAIRFSTDKNGKPLAHYWGGGIYGRWIKMSLDAAKLFVAQDQATDLTIR